MARRSLGKKLRFEVFKRDSFTCQYCGRSAPDVVLHVDHIIPVSEGGENDITNLVTSCKDCNLGKSNRQLDDDAIVKQRKRQLDELQERREQLEMMMEWQRSLIDLEGQAADELAELWKSLVPGYHVTERGLQNLRIWIGKYELQEIIEAMRICTGQYLKYQSGDAWPTSESVEYAWRYIPRVCRAERACKEKPYLKRLFYARGILRNRLSYVDQPLALQLMDRAVQNGINPEAIIAYCKKVSNWTNFRETLEDWAKPDPYADLVAGVAE